jgi:DNA-binding XRE family transcriptional regulator
MNEISSFIKSFNVLMDQPGAPSQSDLARMVGCSPGHIQNIKKARVFGSEQLRRKIAAALGTTYEEMIGADLSLPLSKMPVIRFPFAEIAGFPDGLKPSQPGDLVMIPITTISALFAGRFRDVKNDFCGYFACTDVSGEHLVAVRMPDDSLEPRAKKGAILVVDWGNGFSDRVDDGEFYVCGAPCLTPVRQLFNNNSGGVIAASLDGGKTPPQVLAGADLASIKGKVVAIYNEDKPGLDNASFKDVDEKENG